MRNLANDSALDAALVELTSAGARTHTGDIDVRAGAEGDLVDVTRQVARIVEEADIVAGIALISVPHTTCAVVVNEDEPGVRADFRRALERLAPRAGRYAHDAAPHDEDGEAPNGYAHIRAMLMGAHAVLLPVRDGALALGRWQRIFLAELDRSRPRAVHVTVLGV
ncbi:MAG: YjbQ family protein [Acidobacteria bacterium]|nr:YjbQ family protein [Acidobacteriota bacterium]